MASALSSDDDDPLARAEALIAAGQAGDASRILESLHAAGRGGLLLQAARVRANIAQGDVPAALAIAREASRLYPAVATTAVSLGDALLAAGYLAAAIGEFQRALRLEPDLAEARYRLGCAWLEAGEPERAAQAFEALPPSQFLADRLAEAEAIRQRPRADPRYVRHLFDQFSADYDARMIGELGYEAPHLLRHLAELIGVTQRAPLAILDLGCGTGLSGLAFADLASRLEGIDLSPQMVEKARARGIYGELRVGDIETELCASRDRFDLVVAADTLVYLGDLAALLRAVRNALSPGGSFLFTVERKDGEGYALGPKRRWLHSEIYLRQAARASGFSMAGILECTPRNEAGKPVAGYAVALELCGGAA